jgi:DNA anti-recombination protein RmuC
MNDERNELMIEELLLQINSKVDKLQDEFQKLNLKIETINNDFQIMQKKVNRIEESHDECMIRQTQTAHALNFLTLNYDKIKEIIKSYDESTKRKSDISKEVINKIITVIISGVIFLLASGFILWVSSKK